MKVRDVIKQIKADGWYYSYTKGDHHHYRHDTKPGKVTVLVRNLAASRIERPR